METRKILLTNTFYPPYHSGGDAIHVQQLASLLAKEGHEIHIIFSVDAYEAKQFRSKAKGGKSEQSKDQVFTYPLRSPISFFEPISAYSLGFSRWITKKMEGIIKKIKPDVIHHHNYSLLGNRIFKLNKMVDVSLLTLHDYYPVCQQNALLKFKRTICVSPECLKCSFFIKRPYQFWRHTPINSSILKNDFIISPSVFLRDIILERSDLRSKLKDKFKIIPNFLNPVTPDSKEEYRKKLKDYFVFSGKITFIKGIHRLLNSFSKFSKEFPDINLEIIGNGDLLPHYKRIIGPLRIGNKISFHGKLDYNRNLQLIKSAKGLILPSIWFENCPMTLIESIFLKTIPITTNLGGMREIVMRVNKNLLIDPNNFETSLSEIMKSVITGKIKVKSSDFEKVFHKYYSTKAFLKEYYKLIKF